VVSRKRSLVATIKELKWAILGGEGQLGQAMAMELTKTNTEFKSLSRMQLDITNESDINSYFSTELPDVVLNAAAWTNVDLAESQEEEAELVNAHGPKLIAKACSKFRIKFVNISTDYVFSGVSDSPWNETAEVSPVSAYGRTKAAGESAILRIYPRGSYIVRTAWLYSPWGKNFVKTVLNLALGEGGNIEVVNDQSGQPTSASDLAEQIQRMIVQNVSPGVYHGTNSGQTTWFELAQKIFELAQVDICRVVAINSSEISRPAKRPTYSVLGHSNWAQEGMNPMRPWQDALTDAFPAILQAVKQGE
jgi:dTDP-4-dehydrorhamnose reductase